MRQFPYKKQKEFDVFKKLNSPEKIQDFINSIPANFEINGETCLSPLLSLEKNTAHCIEGAMLASAILWYHGERPIILDLKTSKADFDHTISLFKRDNLWGAISKTNHSVLRYRDPVYRSIRELVMSYFNEYFIDSGRKTLQSYSGPFSLLQYEDDWLISKENMWAIPLDLDNAKHIEIAPKNILRKLRLADKIEIETGKITEWKK